MSIRCRVFVLLTPALIAACALETIDSSHDTLQDAISERQVEKGWIPGWVPAEATNIREVHNLDSNASSLSFDLPTKAALTIPGHCSQVAYSVVVHEKFERAWWPSSEELSEQYAFHRCGVGASRLEFVGIRHDRKRVIHWRTNAG